MAIKSIMRPGRMRARYGKGDFLTLQKRICNINIELTPDRESDGYIHVLFHINGDHYEIVPCTAVGSQFSEFLHALFCLYCEEEDHTYGVNRNPQIDCIRTLDHKLESISTQVAILEHGPITVFNITRKLDNSFWGYPCNPDPMILSIGSTRYATKTYEIDGKDLCYAVAKAYTDALKRYGIFGYGVHSGAECSNDRDNINLNEFLFIKAYALDALEVRELHEDSRYYDEEYPDWYHSVRASAFEKELEILLFDM